MQGKPYRQQRKKAEPTSTTTNTFSKNEYTLVLRSPDRKIPSPQAITSPVMNLKNSMRFLIEDALSEPSGSTAVADFVLCRWFSFIPALLGESRALDASVKCFVAHLLGKTQRNDQMLRYSKSTYVEALGWLRISFNQPSKIYSAHNLCSTMLLCLYEVLYSALSITFTL